MPPVPGDAAPADAEPSDARRADESSVTTATLAPYRHPAQLDEEVHLRTTESAEARRQRLSTGALIGIVAAVMLWLVTQTSGTARFALSNALDEVQLPTISVPGLPVVLVSALLLAAACVVYVLPGMGRWRRWAGLVAGLALVAGFLSWAAAGRSLPFLVSNQLQGTLLLATPLILGALCGVMCERSGVVNVAIEGQMLTAAFAAAVVGSVTGSVTAGLFAAMFAGVLMGAVLALFAITYLMDQVVLGVVINLLALGLTSFLFDSLVKPQSGELNDAPLLEPIQIPLLHKIPLLGDVLFSQTILAYLALISVVVVWFILERTVWGLRIRSVGEHPKAADTVGINVVAIRWSAVLAGGLFAGLGGSFFTLGVTGAFNDDITVGKGFIALAALIMGRWRPGLAALMALFFGFVDQLGSQVQTMGTPISSDWLKLLPYLATIVAVAGLIGRVRGPAADGVPYVK
ncbi:ABC transporter permease [Aestuariimicrobium ganziense]|uniref:ABC transporter permease n=1 Tax=Aestuariimicrobium ganziense TaxID=2773677 RepID=UPI0038B35CF3